MNVKIVSVTQPRVEGVNSAEEFLAYVARVSNPSNQVNSETAPRLIKYLMKNSHWSPFELIHVTVEIKTTRDIARQILRHRSFSFQEFCISGDSLITVSNAKGKIEKISISKLYERYIKGFKALSHAKVFDEDEKLFKFAKINEVFKTGIKPVFEVELFNGKKIKATKEHKFLTEDGFRSLEDITDVAISVSGITTWNGTQSAIGCNGIPLYQDKDWLRDRKSESIENGKGLFWITKCSGMSTATIRKWLKMNGLQYTRKEVKSYTPSWNKGLRYSTGKKHSEETRAKMRESAKRGPESNLWKGGIDRNWRLAIVRGLDKHRRTLLENADYTCSRCKIRGGRLELHHVKPVYSHPHLASDLDNIEVLCHECHTEHHGLNGDRKIWQEMGVTGRLLRNKTTSWSKIKSISFIGNEETFDLEVDHTSHNYVANGIVVHNSQRYAEVTEMAESREARLQDKKNRQNSIEIDPEDFAAYHIAVWDSDQNKVMKVAIEAYQRALKMGIAKEVARSVLPEGLTMSTMYMSGSLRSWIHYCDLRCGNGTQKEHKEVANAIRALIDAEFPSVKAARDSIEADKAKSLEEVFSKMLLERAEKNEYGDYVVRIA